MADAIVLPSLREGLSIALLEAMAFEKPIIATRIGSNMEVLDHGINAHLIPTEDSNKLSDAIKQIVQQKDYIEIDLDKTP